MQHGRIFFSLLIVGILVGSAVFVSSFSDDSITGEVVKSSFKEILAKDAAKKASEDVAKKRSIKREPRRQLRRGEHVPDLPEEVPDSLLAKSSMEGMPEEEGQPEDQIALDFDGDGFSDAEEEDDGSDPNDPTSIPSYAGDPCEDNLPGYDCTSGEPVFLPCIDYDGGEDPFLSGYITGTNTLGNQVTFPDSCSPSGMLVERICSDGITASSTHISCSSYGKVCSAGACRDSCVTNADCSGDALCYLGACQEEMGDFVSWMMSEGYSEDVINVYITEAEFSDAFYRSFLDELLSKQGQPSGATTGGYYFGHLADLLERFFSEPSFEMTLYNVLADDVGWHNDPFTLAEAAHVEASLEAVYGRPFTVSLVNLPVTYMDVFGSDPAHPYTLYPADASVNYPGGIAFDEVLRREFVGLEVNPSNVNQYSACVDNGNYYHFAASTTDTGAYVAVGGDCSGFAGCNIACSHAPLPPDVPDLRTAHEFGHVLGFPHPYGTTPSQLSETDNVMTQPGRIGSAIPLYEEKVLDDESYPLMYPALSPVMRYALEPDFGYTNAATYVSDYNEHARYRLPTLVQCGDAADTRDDDGDGVTNACDACPAYDDAVDSDGDGVADGCDQCSGQDFPGELLFLGLADYDFDGDGVRFVCDSDEWCVGPEYNRFDTTETFLDPAVAETTTGYLLDGSGPVTLTDSCVTPQNRLYEVGCYGGVVVGPPETRAGGVNYYRPIGYCADLGYTQCLDGACV